jgi:4a-hydroxytetrahydrobiopterin dehydratase
MDNNEEDLMEELVHLKCIPCQKGAPQATEEEVAESLAHLPEWKIFEQDGIKRITRTFTFKNFAQALAFTNKVGELAEAESHHPVIVTEWGKVTVTWWTHKIGGLHRNDFIMAAKTDQLL